MKVGFSTVACPERTLGDVARLAETAGFGCVELRTFGDGATQFACDPMLTDPAKTRRIMQAAGAEIGCIATGVKFDDPITPPVIGRVFFDQERCVRDAKRAIDLAGQLECPFVRVFGFEIRTEESRASALERILDRLGKVLDHCRHTGVRLLLENGGSFDTAARLKELIEACKSPLLAAAYSPAVGKLGGEDPVAGIATLGPLLLCVKLRDYRHGKPCSLGSGESPTREVVTELAKRKFSGQLIYELDRAWMPIEPGGDVADVLGEAARVIYEWLGGRTQARTEWPSEAAQHELAEQH